MFTKTEMLIHKYSTYIHAYKSLMSLMYARHTLAMYIKNVAYVLYTYYKNADFKFIHIINLIEIQYIYILYNYTYVMNTK